MKKNLKNGKKVGIAVLSLATLSLIGVGFATWIVTAQDTYSTGNMTVTVADVKDDIRIAVTESATNNTLNFDCDHNGTLLKCGDDSAVDLTIGFTFTVYPYDNAEVYKGIQATIAYSEKANGFGTLAGTHFTCPLSTTAVDILTGITPYTNTDSTISTVIDSTDAATHTLTATTTITFGWGSLFNYVAPEDYAIDATTLNNAKTYLQALKTACTDDSFAITIFAKEIIL